MKSYRLTLLANDSESKGCRQTLKCISPLVIPTEPVSTSGNGQENQTDSKEDVDQTNSHSYDATTENEKDSISSAAGINLNTLKDYVQEDSNLVKTLTEREETVSKLTY